MNKTKEKNEKNIINCCIDIKKSKWTKGVDAREEDSAKSTKTLSCWRWLGNISFQEIPVRKFVFEME